jgi:glutamine amidotransferase
VDAESIRFRFNGDNTNLRVPHMGWNMLSFPHTHPLFTGLEEENRYYFVHSFYMVCSKEENILAKTFYGFPFTSAVANGNIIGVQFHPEKSHKFGMQLLKNFAGWNCS